MPDSVATALGVASPFYFAWIIIGAVVPGAAVRVWPHRFRQLFANDRFRTWFVRLSTLFLLVLTAWVGWAALVVPTYTDPDVADPNPWVAVPLVALLFGGFGAFATARVAGAAAALTRSAEDDARQLVPTSPLDAADFPTGSSTLPVVARVRWDHRKERAIRRVRAVAAVGVVVSFVVSRGYQLVEGTDDPWTPRLGLVWALLVVLAFACTVVLRSGSSMSNRALADTCRAHGWTYTSADGPRVANRFRSAPLLAPRYGGEQVSTRTVDAVTGPWQWWTTEQRAQLRNNRSAPLRTHVQTSWVAWLPGADLPTCAIYGRDDAGATEWAGGALGFELETFNRHYFVRHEYGGLAYAHAMVHPRMIELVNTAMPDGTRLLFRGDAVSLVREGGLRPGDLESHAAFLLAAADLVPRWILRQNTSEGDVSAARPLTTGHPVRGHQGWTG